MEDSGQTVKYEHELHAFDGLGLADVDRGAALAYLLSFVRAHARAVEDARRAQEESVISDRQWWEINGPLLQRVFDPAVYPLAVRVGAAAGNTHAGAWAPSTPGRSARPDTRRARRPDRHGGLRRLDQLDPREVDALFALARRSTPWNPRLRS